MENRQSYQRLTWNYKKAIETRKMREYFRLHDPVEDVVSLYQQASAFCLPSFYEGTPNVICEAMACGRPILISRVCDNERFSIDGENGFLFDPHSADDIANTIIRFASLPPDGRRQMGIRSRERAETLFSRDRFITQFIDLIEGLRQKKR